MTKTIAMLKAERAQYEAGLRRGMWVRLKGWQAHWPQRNAKIHGIERQLADLGVKAGE